MLGCAEESTPLASPFAGFQTVASSHLMQLALEVVFRRKIND